MLPSLGRLTVPTGTNRHSFENWWFDVQEAKRKWMTALKESDISTAQLRASHQAYVIPYEQKLLDDLGVLAQRGDGTWSAEVWQEKKELHEREVALDQKKRNLILHLLEHPEVQVDTETRELLNPEVLYAIWRRRARQAQLGL